MEISLIESILLFQGQLVESLNRSRNRHFGIRLLQRFHFHFSFSFCGWVKPNDKLDGPLMELYLN